MCLPQLVGAGNGAPAVDELMESNHWKHARRIVQQRLSANPDDAQAHAWLSKIKSSFGDFEGSLAEAERAVALGESNAAFHGQLAEACALMADKSSALKAYGYVRCMKKEIAAALAIDPRNTDTMLVEMMFSFKAPAIVGGDKRQARRIADTIVGIAPAWGYLAHARLLQNQGDDASTERVLLRAVEAAPSFYRARASLALFYCCTATHKRPDAAERAAREAIALDPGNIGGYDILARVYATQQRWSDLDAILARAEAAVPDDLAPYHSAAQTLLDIGKDFDRAERYFARYLSKPPEGRGPSHGEARLLLASLYERQGRKAEAMRELMAAVQLQPDLEAAKRELKRLRQS